MSRHPKHEWREVPPDDWCLSCREAGASRVVFLAGDREWVERAFGIVCHEYDEDTVRDVVGIYWGFIARSRVDENRRRLPVQLHRWCADHALERLGEADLPLPGVYSWPRFIRGDYDVGTLRICDQPYSDEERLKLAKDLPAFHAKLAEEGLTLCEDEDGLFVTDDEALIAVCRYEPVSAPEESTP